MNLTRLSFIKNKYVIIAAAALALVIVLSLVVGASMAAGQSKAYEKEFADWKTKDSDAFKTDSTKMPENLFASSKESDSASRDATLKQHVEVCKQVEGVVKIRRYQEIDPSIGNQSSKWTQ